MEGLTKRMRIVIIGSVFSALVSILKYVATDAALREIVFWLMGGFYYATWNDVRLLVPIIIPSFLIMWALGWKLNILSMGDDEARSLGVNPEKYKLGEWLLLFYKKVYGVDDEAARAWRSAQWMDWCVGK